MLIATVTSIAAASSRGERGIGNCPPLNSYLLWRLVDCLVGADLLIGAGHESDQLIADLNYRAQIFRSKLCNGQDGFDKRDII